MYLPKCLVEYTEVFGNGFVAHYITFRNTAGSPSHQAPAITSASSQSAFYRCSFEGYQDTIFAQSGGQFYRECNIYGTIDFICGDAAVIIQDSKIYTRKSSTSNLIVIAASHRESSDSPTGIVFHNCQFEAVPELKPVLNSYKIYLGRPWGTFARTVYIQNDFDIPVDPAGWLEWEGRPSSAPNNVYYGEYKNKGMGSSTSRRVQRPGFRVNTNPKKAEQFTVVNFIQGHTWLPSTGVPFTSGL